MGTGILALDAYLLPDAPRWLQSFGTMMWLVNIVIVAGLIVLMGLRSLMDRRGVRDIFMHPLQSMFFGAIPMAMTTVVNGFFVIAPKYMVPAAYHLGAVLWVINAVVVLGSVFVIPFLMFINHDHTLSRMTAAWLLPIVPPEVAAASGGLLAQHLQSSQAITVIYVSYILWAISVLLSMGILAILLLRLTLHKLPHRDMAVSAWLPLGPLGTGAMAMITLGLAAQWSAVF
jgi:tellurite resistance protein TehA-like permease